MEFHSGKNVKKTADERAKHRSKDMSAKDLIIRLLEPLGFHIVLNMQILLHPRYVDIFFDGSGKRRDIHPFNLSAQFGIVEFKGEKDITKTSDLETLILEVAAYIEHKKGVTLKDVSGFLLLAETSSVKVVIGNDYKFSEIERGVWKSADHRSIFIIELGRIELDRQNYPLGVIAGGKARTKLLKKGIKELKSDVEAKNIIELIRMLDKKLFERMASEVKEEWMLIKGLEK